MVYDPKTYGWWQEMMDAIADTTGQTKRPPIYNDTPMMGTYAYRPSKNEAPKTVIFWYAGNGDLKCQIDGQSVKYGLTIWRNCAEHPITRELFDEVRAGGAWPSEIVLASGESSMTPGKGHNSGDVDKDRDALKGNVDEWIDRIKKAAKLGTPGTQAEADAIADLGTKLNDLLSDAEAKRTAITTPLFKAYKDANEAWNWITPAKTYVTNAKSLAHAFIMAEKARRQAEADKINAEAEAQAQAEAAKRDSGKPADDFADTRSDQREHKPATVAMVQPVPVFAGTRKKVTSANVRKVEFTDMNAAAAYYFAMDPVPPRLLEAMTQITYSLLHAGVVVPGAKFTTETVGR